MNPKHIRIAIGLLCMIVGLWLMFRPAPVAEAVPKPMPARTKPVVAAPVQAEEALLEFGSTEWRSKTLKRGEKWLADRGRDAASLVAAWDISQDESVLLEAAKNFPGDPRVCVAMIGYSFTKGHDATEWIDRLAAAEPQNPAPVYLRAAALDKDGDKTAIIDLLRQAIKLPGKVDLHLRERIMTAREAALASGAGIKDAVTVTLGGVLLSAASSSSPMYQAHRPLTEAIKEAAKSNNMDQLLELSGISLAMANHFAEATLPTHLDEIAQHWFRQTTLEAMPGDTEYGNTGTTVAYQLAQTKASRAELMNRLEQSKGWEGATDAEISSYLDTFLLHGELEAMKALEKSRAK